MWWKRHRIPRKPTTGNYLLRRRSDGTLWTAGHGGYGNMFVAILTDKNKYWFARVRKWRGKWVMAPQVAWVHDDHKEHEFVDMDKRTMVQVGEFNE